MATAAVVIAVGGGIAFATIPDNAGVIHGCYLKGPGAGTAKGTLRVIDSDASESCTASENSLDWNQTGPQGPQGAQGPQGTQGTVDQGGLSNVPQAVARKPKSYSVRLVSEKLFSFTTNNTDIGCDAPGKGNPYPDGGGCAKAAHVKCPASHPVLVGHSVKVVRGTLPLPPGVTQTGLFSEEWDYNEQIFWEPGFTPKPDQVSETPPRTRWYIYGSWGLVHGFGYGQPTSLSLTPKLASFDFRLSIVCGKAKP
jgi:hypothetical protein